jgi:hypothetical protein
MAGNSRHDSEPQATDVTEVELSIRRGRSSSPALQKLDRSRTLRGLLVRELGQLLANLAQTIMVGIMVGRGLNVLGQTIIAPFREGNVVVSIECPGTQGCPGTSDFSNVAGFSCWSQER